jgi:hypothetical protein
VNNVQGVIEVKGMLSTALTTTVISGNTFSGYAVGTTISAAVRVFNPGTLTMTSNTVSGLVTSGTVGFGYFTEIISTRSFAVSITKNKITGGSGAFLVVTDCENPLKGLLNSNSLKLPSGPFAHNRMDTTLFGIAAANLASNGPIASGNLNSITGSVASGNSDITATYNWWAHHSGPSTEGHGFGVKVSTKITFWPFLYCIDTALCVTNHAKCINEFSVLNPDSNACVTNAKTNCPSGKPYGDMNPSPRTCVASCPNLIHSATNHCYKDIAITQGGGSTIQSHADTAHDGDVIKLGAGTFAESVSIKRGMSI